jgi:hypothetical protein
VFNPSTHVQQTEWNFNPCSPIYDSLAPDGDPRATGAYPSPSGMSTAYSPTPSSRPYGKSSIEASSAFDSGAESPISATRAIFTINTLKNIQSTTVSLTQPGPSAFGTHKDLSFRPTSLEGLIEPAFSWRSETDFVSRKPSIS